MEKDQLPDSPVHVFCRTQAIPDRADLLETDFTDLVLLEERQFEHCLALDRDWPAAFAAKVEAVRDWWWLTHCILKTFLHEKAENGAYPDVVPHGTLWRLGQVTADLGVGLAHDVIADAVSRRHGRPTPVMERRAIAYGILYIEAVDRGEIKNRRARSTVRETYDVTAQTVRNWLRRRDAYVFDVPYRNLSPEALEQRMRHHGGIYARIGRGAPSE